MKDRVSEKNRVTKETQVRLRLNLDGSGRYKVSTTLPFLDHMLELFAKHGNIDLTVQATGDTHIDDHHLVEDIGLTLGDVLVEALGDKRGLVRYGQDFRPDLKGKALTTMDETLSYVALDLSGRPYFDFKVKFHLQNKPPISFELFDDFFQAVAMNAKMNLHIKLLQGRNNHHIAESIFKGFGRALAMAVRIDPRRGSAVPSTKGAL
ncbi:MAG: imidazoleglycerol-phosphate dehydratase HisB [Elusimicrobia bacterium]|nr:imidazoleglycerol-phosphate dehydratase HisB [Elusimicrobiota bacterium]